MLQPQIQCVPLHHDGTHDDTQKETLMPTYKAVIRPALEYTSSIWSPLASSTSIHKLQVMQNATLKSATGCTQDTYTSTYSSTRHNTNRKHNIQHTPYTNIQHTSTLQG